MCQAKRDGGKRCPVHQHSNTAAILVASAKSGLTRYQTERLFAELRREGRNSEPFSKDKQRELFANIFDDVPDEVKEGVESQLEKGKKFEETFDAATLYAQTTLVARANQRGEALQERFHQMAKKVGLSTVEVAAKYAKNLGTVERGHGVDVPPEYNQATRLRAVNANLPYDRDSVVALEKLNQLEVDKKRRITLNQAPAGDRVTHYGWDDGRLEVVLQSNPEKVFAYRNVPARVGEAMSQEGASPWSVYENFLTTRDTTNLYESEADAEQDAYVSRCASCGQFAATTHVCATSLRRNELAAEGADAKNIAHQLAEEQNVGLLPTPSTTVAEETEDDKLNPVVALQQYNGNDGNEEPSSPVTMYFSEPELDARLKEHFGDEYFGEQEYTDSRPPMFLPTVEGQAKPGIGVDLEPVVMGELKSEKFLHHSKIFTSSKPNFELPHRERNLISQFPAHIHFFVDVNTDDDYVIKAAYNSRFYYSKNRYTHTPGSREAYTQILTRGRRIPEMNISTGEMREEVEEEQQWVRKMQESSVEVATVKPKATLDNNVVFSASTLLDNPKTSFGRVNDLKKGLNEGKAVAVPVVIKNLPYGGLEFDEQGIDWSTPNRKYVRNETDTITGTVLVRRAASGRLEQLTTHRSLKCSCYEYSTSYRCKHVLYAETRILSGIAQTVYEVPLLKIGAEGAKLLTSRLRKRSDIEIGEHENGSKFVRFTNRKMKQIPKNLGIDARRVSLPDNLQSFDEGDIPSDEQVEEIITLRRLGGYATKIGAPDGLVDIHAALKRADVEVPVKMNVKDSSYGDFSEVEGAILWGKTDNYGRAVAKSDTLKCNCEQYQKYYKCVHTRFLLTQPLYVLGAGVSGAPSMLGSHESFSELTDSANRNLLNDELARRNEVWVEAIKNRKRRIEELQEKGYTVEEAKKRAHEGERAAIEMRAALREEERREEEARIEAHREMMRVEREKAVEASAKYDGYRRNMVTRFEECDAPYTMNKMFEDYKEVVAKKRKGENPIPYRTENVTDGVCAPVEGARKFGVELEFDMPSHMTALEKRQAMRQIGLELHQAQLTERAEQQQYHTTVANGWKNWSFETDSSVDGEVVSPLMSDSPKDWEQLATVCEIITRNGGVASKSTGGHVHMSTGSYGLSTAKHAELLRTVSENEDIMFRVATNPAKGTHRGDRYCKPNVNDQGKTVDANVDDSTQPLLGLRFVDKTSAMNFGAAGGTQVHKNHVEFRMWDGSLNPAVIQQQVMVSAALTDVAEYTVLKEGKSRERANEGVALREGGMSISSPDRRKHEMKALQGRTAHTEETFAESNAGVDKFINRLFRRDEDRKAFMSLFASNKWQWIRGS